MQTNPRVRRDRKLDISQAIHQPPRRAANPLKSPILPSRKRIANKLHSPCIIRDLHNPRTTTTDMHATNLHAVSPIRNPHLQRLHLLRRSQIIPRRAGLDEQLRRISSNICQRPILPVESVREQDAFGRVLAEAQRDALCLEAEFEAWCGPPRDVLVIPAAFVGKLRSGGRVCSPGGVVGGYGGDSGGGVVVGADLAVLQDSGGDCCAQEDWG